MRFICIPWRRGFISVLLWVVGIRIRILISLSIVPVPRTTVAAIVVTLSLSLYLSIPIRILPCISSTTAITPILATIRTTNARIAIILVAAPIRIGILWSIRSLLLVLVLSMVCIVSAIVVRRSLVMRTSTTTGAVTSNPCSIATGAGAVSRIGHAAGGRSTQKRSLKEEEGPFRCTLYVCWWKGHSRGADLDVLNAC